jgi:uncharacterized SAM-binding protein YcdF (DUF218 family)
MTAEAEAPCGRAATERLGWRILAAVTALPFLLGGGYLLAIVLAGPLLTIRSGVMAADTLVVLGGDAQPRATKAARLWRNGSFRNIVVSGNGDCHAIAGTLVRGDVPRQAIHLECRSTSTWQNAEFSAPFLMRLDTKSAVIVTSWFHSLRADTRFQKVCPGIEWGVDPSGPPGPPLAVATSAAGPRVAAEYLKIVVYAARAAWEATVNPPPSSKGARCIVGATAE